MQRYQRVFVRYIKRDWGSGRKTWRLAPDHWNHKVYKGPYEITLRRIRNKDCKGKLWFKGNSIKAYARD